MDGQQVPLANVVTVRRATAPVEISHVNLSRVSHVWVGVDGDVKDVAAGVREVLGRLVPRGLRVELDGAGGE